MARCKDCIHDKVCNRDIGHGYSICPHYVNTADVAPRAEWISVEERLPDNDWGKHWKERKYYLVFTKPSGLMNVAVYGYKEHDWWIDRNSCVLDKKNYKEVTHWMPLPEPPKESKR